MNTTTTSNNIRHFGLSAVMLAAALATGCANMDDTQRRTASGAAIGAVAGAVLSGATGNNAGAGAAVGGIAGAVIGNVWSKRLEAQKRAMEQATAGTGVEVSRTADNQLKLNIPSDVSFDTNSAALKPELRSVLTTFANGLTQNPGLTVRAIGHTDNRGNDQINNPLSLDRADSVRDFLVDHGVSANRVAVDGRGSRQPIASNDSDAGRAQNRRVEIFVSDASTS